MWKIVHIFLALALLASSSCGTSDKDPEPRPGPGTSPISQDGTNASTVPSPCDIRYKYRYAAKDFAYDLATPSLLSVIAWAEGTGNCYNYSFSYQPFSSFAAHPAKSYCANGYCSTAAGRYQFLKATWNHVAIKKGLPTFEPHYQDEGALVLIDEKQVGDDNYRVAYDFPRFKRAMSILSPVWASLPGAPYGQPTRTLEESWQRYQQYLAP